MSLDDQARRARVHADTCTEPFCHARANALEAVQRAESDALLLDALTEPASTEGIEPWSAVSRPDDAADDRD